MNKKDSTVFTSCVSIDLEVARESGRIRAIGAVQAGTGERFVYSGKGIQQALARLDDFADGASFILGHNIIEFDLPHLKGGKPDLRLLKLPVIDTLRLSPLAFPRHPYHHLIKHYKNGDIKRSQVNDPELDARLALEVFRDELEALAEADENLLTAWHWLCTPRSASIDRALDEVFSEIRKKRRPTANEAAAAIESRLTDTACKTRVREILARIERFGWELAYTLAWLSVAGDKSVMPPWVCHQFPEAGHLVRSLRDIACTDSDCNWCRERHDARKELKRWFNFDEFRPEPVDGNGRPMQQSIVETVMAGQSALGILPTGTGKSLCYQIPAISRYSKTGALTVVISPLVALMKDQVDGLEAKGIGCCVTVNGLLSMPERAEALDRIRLGDAGIVLISPEQLRSRSMRRALAQREIGGWVLDEAHCLSRWGHDFRPDYRYVGRFIRESSSDGHMPPVLCLTATAKPEVVADIENHFRENIGIELTVFNGGSERSNLSFEVIPTTEAEKFVHIYQVLTDYLQPQEAGGAIVYCATRQQSQEIADFLQSKEIAADRFHAGLPPETKKDVQRRFIEGELSAIAATNAFGMGIDKPDVRLVIHADIPGSLENYLQEAGRAGRDRNPARCILLYSTDDVERQFGMSARSRLTRDEINGILRALRRLDRRKRLRGEVVATSGEILDENESIALVRDSQTDDTRVRTAVAWLEESELLTREENLVNVFPSSLQVSSLDEAKKKLFKASLEHEYRMQLLNIAEALLQADSDKGISTDELMVVSGLSSEGVRGALYQLERLGIANNDTVMTVFVHTGVERSSRKRLEESSKLEEALIAHMREAAPDQGKGETSQLHLRIAAQTLRDQGESDPLPERLWRIIRGISYDGQAEDDGASGSISVRKLDAETATVTLHREWRALEETANTRREAAAVLLEHLLSCLPAGSRGTDLLAETTLGKLLHAIESDLVLKTKVRKPDKLLDRALLWLHDMDAMRLNKGFVVFRPAMTIRLERNSRKQFTNADFKPLTLHYQGQVLQIHVMEEFAKRGLETMSEALRLAMDYFSMDQEAFLERWLPGRDEEIGRQTTTESWKAIVGSLNNSHQQNIVSDDRDQLNALVLAGPGSGKTRVLVHRIAYLIRVMRENSRSIIALAYNRHAAVDIRRRLIELIGDDAFGVTVLTCHALAMRLAGFSFTGMSERPDDETFRNVMRTAVDVLRGGELLPEEADERRERLLRGFRWILVDEYQDIGSEQYDLISALAGRTLSDESSRLNLFAVGDDDQNIYSFRGASVKYIRQFQNDYGPEPYWLTDNYRSTGNIVEAANKIIEPARERMKLERPIRVDRARKIDSPGGQWEGLDPISQGRVQILPAGNDPVHQTRAVLAEFLRLKDLAPNWDWARCAVIAREWRYLVPVQNFCEANNIPVQMADEDIPRFWRLRETQVLVDWLRERKPNFIDSSALNEWLDSRPSNGWNDLIRQSIEEFEEETDGGETTIDHYLEWLAEWCRDIRRRQRGLLLLTAHRAKGLEFDHVAVLDGGWRRLKRDENPDAQRRLYYVAMTRARQTLMLASFDDSEGFQNELLGEATALRREITDLPLYSEAAEHRHIQPSLDQIDLGFAGRHFPGNPIHRAIGKLSIGDSLNAQVDDNEDGRWVLRNSSGDCVGRLAKSFEPPSGMRCRSAEVFAIVRWSREISDPDFYDSKKCDEWETVVPALVFEPDRT